MRSPILVTAVLTLALLAPDPAAAQDVRLHVEVDPARPLVGIAMTSSSGSAADPEGLGGLSSLAAETVRRALLEHPGVVDATASVSRSGIEFTVSARPDDWSGATARLRDLLFDSGPEARFFEAARADVLGRFGFTADSPVREVDVEAARLLTGLGSDWSRPVEGDSASVAALTFGDLSRIRDIWRADTWAVALTGSVEEASVRALLGVPPRPDADSAGVSAPPAQAVGSDAAPDMAWTSPDRVRVVREVTSTWIVAAFPLPSDLSMTGTDHLVHRVNEILNPFPPDPGLFEARVERLQLPSGPVLHVRASVLPEAADRWEARIRALPELIDPPADPDFFRWERRRFRAHLLLGDAAPTAHAARLARDLLLLGRVRRLREEAWELEPDDLSMAAARLGPPRILVFGPDLGARDTPPG